MELSLPKTESTPERNREGLYMGQVANGDSQFLES